MQLIEVDPIDTEQSKTGLAMPSNRVRARIDGEVAPDSHGERSLGSIAGAPIDIPVGFPASAVLLSTTDAVTDPRTKLPVSNGRRDIWTTSLALQTALNTSYMAEQLSVFGIVVGDALLLSGFGFAILAIGGALRNPETAFAFFKKPFGKAPRSGKIPTVPVA